MIRRILKRKALTRLLICIVVGVISSVGVAWVAVATIDVPNISSNQKLYQTAQTDPDWEYRQATGNFSVTIVSWPLGQISSIEHLIKPKHELVVRSGPWWSVIHRKPDLTVSEYVIETCEEAWGWPVVSMVSVRTVDLFTLNWTIVSGIQIGTRARPVPGPYLLPIRPIWRGLMVNTLLYGIVTWFVISLYVVMLSSHRRKRGQCIYCRYNIRDLPVCPECGSDVVFK